MECKAATDLIARRLSGNAGPAELEALRRHESSCAGCAASARGFARVWELTGAIRPATPTVARVPALPGRRRIAWVASAAAALAVAGLLALAFPPKPPLETVYVSPKTETPTPVAAPIEDPSPEVIRVEKALEDVEREMEQEFVPAPASRRVIVANPETPVPAPVVPEPLPELATPGPIVPETTPAPRPVEPPPVAVAVLARVAGDVVLTRGAETVPAKAGQPIPAGAGLQTRGKNSQAVVEFPDSTRLVLGAETVVASIADRVAGEGRRIVLKQGIVAAQVAKQPAAEIFSISTPGAEARVLGTRFTLSAAAASTRLDVREGKVRLMRKDDNAFVDVPADTFAVAAKGVALALKPSPASGLRETFDRRGTGAWTQGGDPGQGLKASVENGSLTFKASPKGPDVGVPTSVPDSVRKPLDAARRAEALAGRKEPTRSLWLETRASHAWTEEEPLKLRVRLWNSAHDDDHGAWIALNRGVAGQGVFLERRGTAVELWFEGGVAPAFRSVEGAAQEWESLELWISKDRIVVRRNDATLATIAHPLKARAGLVSIGARARADLAQEREVRVDQLDATRTTKAEFDEVSR